MKVLYWGSNPIKEPSLLLSREVTSLQQQLRTGAQSPVEFRFFPALPIEQIGQEVFNFNPDIVHISAHSQGDSLVLSNSANDDVSVKARDLEVLLAGNSPPALVYLSACNSANIAEQLQKTFCTTIGTTAEISNRAARESARIFYERLLQGHTLGKAFEHSKTVLIVAQQNTVETVLYPKDAHDVERVFLVLPKLVARFPIVQAGIKRGMPNAGKRAYYDIELGITGCPNTTTQVILFTDDDAFAVHADSAKMPQSVALAAAVTRVVRERPVRGEIWDSECQKGIAANYALFGTGVTADGNLFSASTTLVAALKQYYDVQGNWNRMLPAAKKEIEIAIRELS